LHISCDGGVDREGLRGGKRRYISEEREGASIGVIRIGSTYTG